MVEIEYIERNKIKNSCDLMHIYLILDFTLFYTYLKSSRQEKIKPDNGK